MRRLTLAARTGVQRRWTKNTRQNDSTSDNRVAGVFPADGSFGTTTQQIRVVLNWTEELKARVPTK
jgi:hypothetical protein